MLSGVLESSYWEVSLYSDYRMQKALATLPTYSFFFLLLSTYKRDTKYVHKKAQKENILQPDFWPPRRNAMLKSGLNGKHFLSEKLPN